MKEDLKREGDWEGSSDGEPEPAYTGEAYQQLLETLASGKDVLSGAERALKRRKIAAGVEGLAKFPKAKSLHLQTAAVKRQV
jgi:hypothetical protein